MFGLIKRLKYFYLLCFLFGGILAFTAFGEENLEKSSVLHPFTKTTLDNGLTIIVKEVHTTPLATVDIWVGTGAIHETPEEAGISHFFEHMLFKGTTTRGVGQISREIQAVGGYLNAATSLDTTHYYVVVPSEAIHLALDVEADAIRNSVFDPEEIEKERQVILEEMRLKEDNPQKKLGWLAYRAAFAGTPYTNDVLGTPESLAKISRETFLQYHQKRYLPNNMVVTVVGDVNTDEIIQTVKRLFGDLKPGVLPSIPEIETTPLDKVKRIEQPMGVDQNYIYMSFPGPSFNHPDTPVLSVLGVILGGGKSSRLYQELREEKKLVNTIGSGYQAFQRTGMFAVYAESREDNVDIIEKAVAESLKQIADQGVSEAELKRAKILTQSYLAYELETNAGKAELLGEFAVGGSLEDLLRYESQLNKVSMTDIQRVAAKYLTAGYVVAVIKPEVKK